MDLSHFVPPPPPAPKPVPPPQPVVPPQPKPKPLPKPKEVVKPAPEPVKKVLESDKILTAKKDIQENNVTKSAKKASKKVVKKEKPKEKKKLVKKVKKQIKKRIVKKQPKPKEKKITKARPRRTPKQMVHRQPRPKKYASPLANSLMGSSHSRSIQPMPSRSVSSAAANRIIKKLYGSEFDGYSPAQKKFIRNNLALIHRITQMTLVRNGYPEIAARTGQQGTNVVSFYLHPNGNITGLHLDRRMGYEALDRNTLQVIRIAYKDYPLPTKTTKIKFFVQYSINGY
jgi:TonB family protein